MQHLAPYAFILLGVFLVKITEKKQADSRKKRELLGNTEFENSPLIVSKLNVLLICGWISIVKGMVILFQRF
jgi:hypothetical protein